MNRAKECSRSSNAPAHAELHLGYQLLKLADLIAYERDAANDDGVLPATRTVLSRQYRPLKAYVLEFFGEDSDEVATLRLYNPLPGKPAVKGGK